MNILVTGSAGFIGRFLVPLLGAQGHTVLGIDKRSGIAFGDYYRFLKATILDEPAVDNLMQGVDVVIHMAAEHKDFGVPESLYYQVNVDGTEVLLRSAARHNVKKFVFFSSVAVYGDQPIPTHEALTPEPDSHYGKSKLQAEQRIRAWADQDPSRQVVFIRPTVVFGPFNYANMYRLIQSVARRRYIGVGDGNNIKSIGYVENVAAATIFLLERMRSGVDIFNYADSPHMTTRELVSSIAQNLQIRVPPVSIPKSLAMACALPFDIVAKVTRKDLPLTAKRIDKFTSPTHHEAEKILRAGFMPPCSLPEGVRRTASWYVADQNASDREEIGPNAA